MKTDQHVKLPARYPKTGVTVGRLSDRDAPALENREGDVALGPVKQPFVTLIELWGRARRTSITITHRDGSSS
jgi:hypothetical protein